ncbi:MULTISPECIES: hypothetical protein [Acinetobacter]|uniref:hypothetical protein n=1 Tax=Acinetobacter TaxID=469 RepID=UPI001436AA14|nr:hypothetical protein [Acinetobacter towneri]MCA4814177.1 hypothetical protein [Acinetobacter towneri]QIV93152.1 hypothetical protein GVU25_10310 [Acinetobacter towneri]
MAGENKIVDIHIEMTPKALGLLKIMDLKQYLSQGDPFMEITISADLYENSIGKKSIDCGFEELTSATLELNESKLFFKNVSTHWGSRIISDFNIDSKERSISLIPVQSTAKWLVEYYDQLFEDL